MLIARTIMRCFSLSYLMNLAPADTFIGSTCPDLPPYLFNHLLCRLIEVGDFFPLKNNIDPADRSKYYQVGKWL